MTMLSIACCPRCYMANCECGKWPLPTGPARDAASRSDARSGDVLTIHCEKCDSATTNVEDEYGEIFCSNCQQNAAESAYERLCEDFHDGDSTAPWPENERKRMEEARKLK